MGLKLIS